MKVIGYLLITFFMLIYPMYLGRFLCLKIKKEYCEDVCFSYVLGFTLVIASFQLICVPLAIFNCSFSTVVVLFSVVSLILFVISVTQVRIKNLFPSKTSEVFKDPKIKKLFAFLCITILFQIGTLLFFSVYELAADDATYLTISDSALKHNILYRFAPYTGEYQGIGIERKRITVSYYIFISFLSKISGIHILELAHTMLPIFIIPLAYCAYYLFSKMVFSDHPQKRIIFMIMLSLLMIWGAYSIYTVSFRMLVVPWQGKALMAIIFLPFLLYVTLQILVNGWNYLEALIFIAICIAGQATSLMVNGLFLLTVFALFLCVCIKNVKKDFIIKNLKLFGIFTLICGLDTVFYLFFNNFVNILGLE